MHAHDKPIKENTVAIGDANHNNQKAMIHACGHSSHVPIEAHQSGGHSINYPLHPLDFLQNLGFFESYFQFQ